MSPWFKFSNNMACNKKFNSAIVSAIIVIIIV